MAAPPAIPPNEPLRVAALRAFDVLDTAEEEIYDAITRAAADVCGTPMASLTFVDSDRQWFKSKIGLIDRETSRDISFCAHAIHGEKLFVVEDARADDRFREYSNVTGSPGLRFYAGMPLLSPDGLALGTLCVLDTVPRKLTDVQARTLGVLAESVMRILNLRRNSGNAIFAKAVDMTSDGVTISDTAPDGSVRIVYANSSFLRFCGRSYVDVINQPCTFPVSSAPSVRQAFESAYHHREATTAEANFNLPSNACLWDRVSFIPYVNASSSFKYMVAIHRDISAAREGERQAQQLHAMRTTLATVAHVVRNFMNASQLYIMHAASGNPIDQEMQNTLQNALDRTREQLTGLERLPAFKDRPTPFGISILDTGEREGD